MLVGLLPWTLLLPQSFISAWKNTAFTAHRFQARRFLLIYALGVIAFFSSSGSKLPTYILPAFPPLATLIALHLCNSQRKQKHLIGLGSLIYGLLFLLAGLLLRFPEQSIQQGIPLDLDPDMLVPYSNLAPWLAAGGVALLLASATMYALKERFRMLSYSVMAIAGLIAAMTGLQGASSLAVFNSASPWVASWQSQVKPNARVFSVNTYDQSLDFYLKRTVILVNFEDELGFGLQQEPHLSIPQLKDFLQTWGTQPNDLAIFEIGQLPVLQAAGMKMHVLAQNTRHVVVSPP